MRNGRENNYLFIYALCSSSPPLLVGSVYEYHDNISWDDVGDKKIRAGTSPLAFDSLPLQDCFITTNSLTQEISDTIEHQQRVFIDLFIIYMFLCIYIYICFFVYFHNSFYNLISSFHNFHSKARRANQNLN